jgi:hypothetical protein
MSAQKPTIAEFVVSLNQLDSITFGEAKLIRTPGYKIIWLQGNACQLLHVCHCRPQGRQGNINGTEEGGHDKMNSRITTRVSPASGRGADSLAPGVVMGGGMEAIDGGCENVDQQVRNRSRKRRVPCTPRRIAARGRQQQQCVWTGVVR